MERSARILCVTASALLISAAATAMPRAGDREALPAGFAAVFGSAGLDGDERAAGWNNARADAHAPIGVRGDHLLERGEWMVSLRAVYTRMAGNRDGRSSLGTQQVFDRGYSVVPTKLTSEALELGLMYAPTDRLTLTAMLPYAWKTMEQELNPALTSGGAFETESDGLGDLRLGVLYGILAERNHRAQLDLGLGLPTGSVTASDEVAGAADARLPYAMQLGSGSIELMPGATYAGQIERWSWGAQFRYTARLDQNSEDYTVGDRIDATAWGAHRWSDGFSSSLRLIWADWEAVDGRDRELSNFADAPFFPSPASDPSLQAGERIDVGLGFEILGTGGSLRGQRLGFEFLFPLSQDLDGPQLETDWSVVAGWRLAF